MDQILTANSRDVPQLLEFVAYRKNVLADVVIEPHKPPPFRGADRWLLASLLQKAIRRSDLDVARRAGHQLLISDPTRLWRRLMVVGLEDIAIGDPEAACLAIALAAIPEARALFGSATAALDILLKSACDATKDRTGDAFGSIAKEMERDVGHSLEELPASAKLAVLSYGHLPWRRRLRAAFLLGRDWAPAQERKSQFWEMAEYFRSAGVPEILLSACHLYRGKSEDLLPLFVPLAYCLWLGQGSPKTMRTVPIAYQTVDGIPDYGFDPLHTRPGRRAVDVWLKSQLVPPPFSSSQVAITLWNREAAASRYLLSWPLGEEITQQGRSADLMTRGLSPTRHESIDAWVEEHREVLRHARQAVWESARPTRTEINGPVLVQKANPQ